MDKNNHLAAKLKLGETIFGIFILLYFLVYQRDTLSDFIVLTLLCIILFFTANRIRLPKPKSKPLAKIDIVLAIFSVAMFVLAWIYGFQKGKVNSETASTSLFITGMYFYYAWIQHFLAQRYLSTRMLQVSKEYNTSTLDNKWVAALLTGAIFSILHIPYPHLMLSTLVAGCLFSYYFLSTHRLLAVVVAHALISSTMLYWLLDDHPFTEITGLFY